MTNQELQKLLDYLKYVPFEERDETTNVILKAAADSLTLDKLQALTDGKVTEKTITDGGSFTLRLTEKELAKLPKTFKKEFRTDGCTAHVRKRKSGKSGWNYEIRYRKNGYNVAVSANELEQAKKKFIDKLHEIEKFGNVHMPTIPSAFKDFSNYFFENFYKRKVKAETYRIGLNQYKNHIEPNFANIPLKRIAPQSCQDIIDNLDKQEKFKTADDIFSLLNMIFKTAVKLNLLENNPMNLVLHTQHERKHGVALTKAEEKLLLESTKGTPQHVMFAIALYTGLRPNEYETARIDGKFIVAINSKRKNNKVEYKKIPVTPMLAPYLTNVDEIKFCSLRILRDRFNKLFPKHKLYDLRTTFYTRCTECGVAEVAIKKFVGHTLGGLAETYTDLSDEFLLAEGQKFNYAY